MGFTPSILTASALSKRPFFTYCKMAIFSELHNSLSSAHPRSEEDSGIVDMLRQTDLGTFDNRRTYMRNHYVKENDYCEILMSIRDYTELIQTEQAPRKNTHKYQWNTLDSHEGSEKGSE